MSLSSNVASDTPVKTNQLIPYAKSIKEYFSDKGYVFYIGIGLTTTVILTGVGLYFLRAPKPPKPRTRSTSRKKGPKTNKSTSSRTAREDAEAEEYERYTIDQINALPKEKRVAASQLLKTRGNTVFGKGDYERGIKLYTQALAFNQDPIFYGNRAACYYNKNEFQKVIEDCTNSLELDPYYVKALNRRAMAYENLSQYEEALHDYTAACIINDYKNETSVRAIERLLRIIATNKAQEIMQTRPKRLPSSTMISLHLETFQKMAFDATDTRPVISQEDKTGDDYFNDAQEFLSQQKYNDAMKAFDQAIELKCEHLDYAYNMRGTFAYLMGDFEGSLSYFEKALELKPNYVQVHIKRATVYTEQGKKLEECLDEFSKAIEIDENDPDIYYHRGQAIDDYQRRIELDPEFVYAYIQLVICQYKSKGIADAIKVCEDAIEKFNDSAELYNYYGELLVENGDINTAIEKFDKAIEFAKGKFVSPLIHRAMLVLHPNNNFTDAENYCQRALDIDPDNELAHLVMGEILLSKNDCEGALRYFEKYQEFPRTENELIGVQEYIEAAKSRIVFKKKYPQVSERTFGKI
nr:2758_t:CDS:10 [Entrophospora candida]